MSLCGPAFARESQRVCVYVCVLKAKLINSSHLFQMLTIQLNLSCNKNHHGLLWRVNKTIMHNLITKPYSCPINMTSTHTEAYYANCLYSLVNRVIDLVGPVSQHRRSSLNGVIQPSGPHKCTLTHVCKAPISTCVITKRVILRSIALFHYGNNSQPPHFYLNV